MILDGKKLNKEISESLKKEISLYDQKPKLMILQIGDNASSNVYIKTKIKFAERIGVLAEVIKFNDSVLEKEVIETIQKLNNDETVHGIIVQLPIPSSLKTSNIIDQINPLKDVDGMTSVNLAKLFRGEDSGFIPATTKGVATLLKKNNFEVKGKNITMIGRSVLVGKPTAMYLTNLGATVTLCHKDTPDLSLPVKDADIVITATGVPGLVKESDLKSNQIIIDIGITKKGDQILGDTDLSKDSAVAAFSPVPGGVGPMTVACLFENLLEAYRKQR